MIQRLAWIAFFLSISALSRSSEPETQPLSNLCVDNIRTQSWWTYSICFYRSVIQVHVDSRTKQLQEKVYLGEFRPQESNKFRQVYRTSEPAQKTCASVDENGLKVSLHRTTIVQLKCCDDIVHLRRQSRHTFLPSNGAKQSSLSHYWGPELASVQAVEELQTSRNKRADNSANEAGKSEVSGGFHGAASTATGIAYLHSVEEPSPCNYEVNMCSDLACVETVKKVPAGMFIVTSPAFNTLIIDYFSNTLLFLQVPKHQK